MIKDLIVPLKDQKTLKVGDIVVANYFWDSYDRFLDVESIKECKESQKRAKSDFMFPVLVGVVCETENPEDLYVRYLLLTDSCQVVLASYDVLCKEDNISWFECDLSKLNLNYSKIKNELNDIIRDKEEKLEDLKYLNNYFDEFN